MEDVGRTFVPETSFVSSPDTEKERFLYHTASLAEGFYFRHGFVVCPKVIDGYNKQCVVMPEVLSLASVKFWKDAKIGGQTMPKVLSALMRKEFEDIKFPEVDKRNIQKFEFGWRKVEKEFWQEIQTWFPKERKWIGSVEVRITKLGGLSSHYLLNRKPGQKLVINVREDGGIKEIASLIILALIWPMKDELNLSFNKRMTLRDFLMSREELRQLFPKWVRTDYEDFQIPEKLRRQSDEYLDFLKVPRQIDPIEIINKNWSVFGEKETKFLKLLIKNRGEIATYDQIADDVWGDGEFKTYWAINKIFQRTQRKIVSLGVDLKIKGFRGRGYKLS